MTSIFLGWATEWTVVPLAERVSMRRRQNLVNDDGFSYGQGKSEILWGVEIEMSSREKFKHSKENPGTENKFVSHHHMGNGWCKGGAGVPQGERVPKQVKRARTGTRTHLHLRISHPVPNGRKNSARASQERNYQSSESNHEMLDPGYQAVPALFLEVYHKWPGG